MQTKAQKKRKFYLINHVTGELAKVKVGEPQSSGWLHYELRDGTNGLAKPGKWSEGDIKDVSK